MPIVVVIFLFFFLNTPIYAQTKVAVRPAGENRDEFNAFVHSHNSIVSFSNFWLQQIERMVPREDLQKALARAQDQFLNGSIAVSRSLFETVLELRTSADWPEEDRKGFQYAALRLAQLSEDASRQSEFLKIAASIGGPMLDESLFPPPLVKKYSDITKEIPERRMQLDLLFPNSQLLLVDGKPFFTDSIKVIQQDDLPHRFTWISDAYLPESWVGKWQDLSSHNLNLVPIVSGSCSQSSIHSSLASHKNIFAYFEETCVQNLKPITSTELKLPVQPAQRSNHWLKSKWFWIGLGGTVTAFALLNQRHHDSSPTPTSTVGF